MCEHMPADVQLLDRYKERVLRQALLPVLRQGRELLGFRLLGVLLLALGLGLGLGLGLCGM